MLRKLTKPLFIVVLLWFLSIVFLIRKFKFNSKMFIDDDIFIDNAVFVELRNENFTLQSSTSKFKVWKILPVSERIITLEDKYSMIIGHDLPPGANGKPVILKDNLKIHVRDEIVKGWDEYSFNRFVSDLIPIDRKIPDPRDPWCQNKTFNDLPKATVIICFYNEAWSTLLRTIHSVLNNSPVDVLEEILLVDDYSTIGDLGNRLQKYVQTLPKVKLIRTGRREGIVRTRILGTKSARSPVVVFLDSHTECTTGWLEPLLERVSEDPTRVVSPVIDVIHPSTFEYISQDVDELHIGGFTWGLKFTWISIPNEILSKREHEASPVKTPTISGGLFAINKQFFEKTGFYDDEFNIWGAENLELSFKTWMCGGSLEIVPCSHVGHIFRSKFPYDLAQASVKRNHVRLAEVWLDEYAKYFYERMGNNKGEFGDVTKRKELRQKLNCKNFSWYLQNVYPEMSVPDKYVANGQIISLNYDDWCLDASVKPSNVEMTVNLVPCHRQGGNQFWVYTKLGEIRHDRMCLDHILQTIMLYMCRGRDSSQIWLYSNETKKIIHKETGKCLTAIQNGANNQYRIVLQNCINAYSQKWIMENYNPDKRK